MEKRIVISVTIPEDPSDPVAVIALAAEGGDECPGYREVVCGCNDPAGHAHPRLICGNCRRPSDGHFIPGPCWEMARRAVALLDGNGHEYRRKFPR